VVDMPPGTDTNRWIMGRLCPK